ncbi:hypothetical protein Ahy_B01g052489 [Arachis hypogaea]|uniref:Vacuolar protein sorting-associated protein 54 C-terminal domain-containing protein n=1 Tax=Arachis hypogaea TaxID=3818 RepID=A0A445APM1_ARAHY|nr:hypothetical protein Ahy_B01g052489 [Arachis hypogaea]
MVIMLLILLLLQLLMVLPLQKHRMKAKFMVIHYCHIHHNEMVHGVHFREEQLMLQALQTCKKLSEAVFAACDAAHGRWAKLLVVRAVLHPRLKLQDFQNIYNITQEFITATEKVGGRLGNSIRGTLQSQTKSFVDFQHESRMTKIRAVLDQETWVEIDIPDEFQSIIKVVFSSDALHSESLNEYEDVSSTSYNDVLPTSETGQSNAEQPKEQTKSTELPTTELDNTKAQADSIELIAKFHQHNVKIQRKTIKDLHLRLFTTKVGLILLKMLSEYIDKNNLLPPLSSEIVHRVIEILKLFNTQTCQLMLGAGAMQVSGLKSSTSTGIAKSSH